MNKPAICPLCQNLLEPFESEYWNDTPEYRLEREKLRGRVFWASVVYVVIFAGAGFLAGYLTWGIHPYN